MQNDKIYLINQYVRISEGRQQLIDMLSNEDTEEYHGRFLINTPQGQMTMMRPIEAESIDEAFEAYDGVAVKLMTELQSQIVTAQSMPDLKIVDN